MTTERMIHGVASSERACPGTPSADGTASTVMLARGCGNLLTPLPLLLEHRGPPIGACNYFRWLPEGKLYVRARVHNAEVWQEIERYKLRALSSCFIRRDYEIELCKEGHLVKLFTRYEIKEISLVHRALNQDCVCAIFRGGPESRIANQMSFSEHRAIHDRARRLLGQLERKFPKPPSRVVSRKKIDPGPVGLSRSELRRVEAWLASERKGEKHGK